MYRLHLKRSFPFMSHARISCSTERNCRGKKECLTHFTVKKWAVPAWILIQGWVCKFSSVNTNFFQARTDNAWQTPGGLRLTQIPHPHSRLWQAFIPRYKNTKKLFFLPPGLISFVSFSAPLPGNKICQCCNCFQRGRSRLQTEDQLYRSSRRVQRGGFKDKRTALV